MINLGSNRKIITLTGGPCGGKTTLINELCNNPLYKNIFVPIPEAVFYVLQTQTSPKEKTFQKLMVEVQSAMENALDKCLEPDKIFICHRGTLDPLAYWLENGWNNDAFFTFTKTSIQEHYNRYYAVIHLQTSAVNAKDDYRFYPNAPRHENAEQASKIDALLAKAWKGHSNYNFIESRATWEPKRDKFYNVISALLQK